jgi:hypothetical protein
MTLKEGVRKKKNQNEFKNRKMWKLYITKKKDIQDTTSRHRTTNIISGGGDRMMHSQLLEELKCESQIEDIGRIRSQGTLLGSQHYRGVEGRAGAPRWD